MGKEQRYIDDLHECAEREASLQKTILALLKMRDDVLTALEPVMPRLTRRARCTILTG